MEQCGSISDLEKYHGVRIFVNDGKYFEKEVSFIHVQWT
jgi:hypothetical protein